MTSQVLIHTVITCFLVATMCAGVSADTIFFDDFSDGDIQNDVPVNRDGMPVRWDPIIPAFPADYDASSGDFLLIPPPGGAVVSTMAAMVQDLVVSDMSVRAQVTKIQDSPIGGERVGIVGRLTPGDPGSPREEYAGYEVNIDVGGELELVRIDAPDRRVLRRTTLPVNVTEEDVLLQFDAFGDSLKVWAWRPGDRMPLNPQIDIVDGTYASGTLAVISTDGPNDSIGVFRFVQLADMHIPEPSTIVLVGLACIGALCLAGRENHSRL